MDTTPPAASHLDQRFADIAVCLAEQDQTISDLKNQLVAQESRIHVLEKDMEEFDKRFAACVLADITTAKAIDEERARLDWLTQRWDDVYCFLRSQGFRSSESKEPDAPHSRGIPLHGGPIGTAIIADMYEVPEPKRESHEVDPVTGHAP